MKPALLLIFAFSLAACKQKAPAEEEVPAEAVQTPVTVTSVETIPMSEYVELNATSAFLQSNIIKSSAAGYLRAVQVKLGQQIQPGQFVFLVKTREAQALGNTINNLDPSFRFTGEIRIRAAAGGVIRELNHQVGDYVQDGEQLAVLSDARSFGFVLNVPYELRQYVGIGKSLTVDLPDGSHLPGTVASMLPDIDSAAQTQRMMIRVDPGHAVLQNLIAKVRIVKQMKTGASSVLKGAVLTDESQANFWVMKMVDSVTAVKVPIIKGMETTGRVEILRPVFAPGDRILLTGNYGLPDTAKVKIVKGDE